jgi:transcriptional regulator with XRE-family HTH domain
MSKTTATKQAIANRLREARKLAGLSQGQVARTLGMHRPTVSEIEAGNRNVTAEELARFAEIYDVGIDWLSGHGANSLGPHDDRLQLAFRELSKLKPDDIDRLMRVLAAMRDANTPGAGASNGNSA